MKLKTISIKGKQYVEVKERIRYFNENFPKWRMETEFSVMTDQECLCVAKIFDENDRQVRMAHAHEVKSGHINMTSMYENCETSAVGRALGMLGIGIDVAVASADEVRMAIDQQEMIDNAPFPAPSKATKEDRERLFNKFNDLCSTHGVDAKEFVTSKLGENVYKDKTLMYKDIRHYMMKLDILEADIEAFADKPAFMDE